MSGFERFISECGLSQDDMDRAKKDISYQPMDSNEELLVVLAKSPIEGLGIFARARIGAGEMISPAFNAGVWSYCGRFLNHSDLPNVAIHRIGGVTLFNAKHTIEVGDELTVDYRQVREVISQ